MFLTLVYTAGESDSHIGSAKGSGHNGSASQGLTAVTTTSNDTANSDVIHNSAAAGSSAADIDSSSAADSQTGAGIDGLRSSGSKTGGDTSAKGKAANVASDSSEVSTAVAPGKVSGRLTGACGVIKLDHSSRTRSIKAC